MNRIGLVVCFFLLGCAHSIDVSHSTNESAISYDTKVNGEPITQDERIRLLDLEAHRHRTNFDALEKRRIPLQSEHDRQFAILEKEFPECARQRHCNSDIFRGSYEKVTRYNELISLLRQSDFALFAVLEKIKQEEHRHDLVSRNIYNRYLVHEILEIPQSYPFFNRFIVHTLEVFTRKKDFINRILHFAGDIKPKIRADLVFTMFGQEIDDGAVLLTLDIIPIYPGTDDNRKQEFLLTVLVNSHQLDPQYYEKIFLKEWAASLWNPDRTQIKKEAYCGFYSIASDTLMDQYDKTQVNLCSDYRDILHGKSRSAFAEHLATHDWLLPLAYFEPQN